jgi:hypothetical protein
VDEEMLPGEVKEIIFGHDPSYSKEQRKNKRNEKMRNKNRICREKNLENKRYPCLLKEPGGSFFIDEKESQRHMGENSL